MKKRSEVFFSALLAAFMMAAALGAGAFAFGGAGFTPAGGESVTATAPISKSGSNLSCNVASGAQAGCLSSADWTTFNSKLSSVPDPIVPGDGTQNVTGGVTATKALVATSGGIAASGPTILVGLSDVKQLIVRGNSTQTTNPFEVQNSGGISQFSVSNIGASTQAGSHTVSAGGITVTGTSQITGAAATDAYPFTVKKGGGESTNDGAVCVRDSSNNQQIVIGVGSSATNIYMTGSVITTGTGPVSLSPTNYATFGTGGTGSARVQGVGGTNTTQTVWAKNAPITHTSGEVNGASAQAHVFDTGANLSNATAKLASFQNQGTEKIGLYSNGTIATVGGLALGGVTAVKTANYTATLADSLVRIDISGGAFTLTLPAANAAKGQVLRVKCTALHATNRLTVSRAGSDTIQTITATAQTTFSACAAATYDTFELMSDGTSVWYMTNYVGTTVP